MPHASRDPGILKDRNLENEDIFEIIRNPPDKSAVRIFEKPEFWDSTTGLTQAATTQGIATIQLPSGPLSMDGAQWHLLKHTLTNSNPRSPGAKISSPERAGIQSSCGRQAAGGRPWFGCKMRRAGLTEVWCPVKQTSRPCHCTNHSTA